MIIISGLNKSIKRKKILENINLEIAKSRTTAILGPNGSGKTTMLKILLGLMFFDDGKILIDNKNINDSHLYKHNIGYMPQNPRFPENLTVSEIIKLLKDIRQSSHNYDEELFQKFKLAQELNKPFKVLSGGTKQKLSAMLAFMFNPTLLILDEPTAGLDPISSVILKDKITKEKNNGKTIVLTSHIMSDIEELADDIVVLLEGKVLFAGGLNDLFCLSGFENLEKAIINLLEENSEWGSISKLLNTRQEIYYAING